MDKIVDVMGMIVGVALVTTIVLSSARGARYVSIQTSLMFRDEAYQSVDILITGQQSTEGLLHGELYADMFLTNGKLFTLVIDFPSRRYRLIDDNGHESAPSQESFGEAATLRWLSMAGLNPAEPQVGQQALWMKVQIDKLLSGNSNVPFGPLDARPRYSGGSFSDSSRSGRSSQVVFSSSVIGWSMIWLFGLMRAVRPRFAPQSAQMEAVT